MGSPLIASTPAEYPSFAAAQEQHAKSSGAFHFFTFLHFDLRGGLSWRDKGLDASCTGRAQ
jgi:hypothetical protein